MTEDEMTGWHHQLNEHECEQTPGDIDKDTTRKLQELINEFSKVTGYKINTQNSLAFLHINNEESEREIKETNPFTTSTKRIKYLEINLPKEINDLYADTLMKELKRRYKQMER